MRQYYVYIAANHSRTLYTGVTNDLARRMYQHKHNLVPGFTSRYSIHRLVYFEITNDVRAAIAREKQIKGWRRRKKLATIESMNPAWDDLSQEWFGRDDSPEKGRGPTAQRCHSERSEESGRVQGDQP